MSTFKGKIEEIPEISVDRFEEHNYDSEAYFLSHCHTDHMVGLNSSQFEENILKRNCFIFASSVTKAILRQLVPYLADRIKELEFHTPTPIYLNNRCISVIPIPSGHCPGSVMFLFEAAKTVLYTGDYRINPEDLIKIKAFFDSHGKLKNIHKIYLDTTFFFEDYKQFPTREESLRQIINLIEEWVGSGENNIIHLSISAKYGYEYVIMEIFNKLKIPVHTNERAFNFYSLIPQLDGAATFEDENTKIHCNCGPKFNTICKGQNPYNVRTIRMSAMSWKNQDLEEGFTATQSSDYYLVCYSTHASYTEGVQLIKFLKPEAIEPCVLRLDDKLNNQIYATINELLSMDDGPSPKKPKLFDLKKIKDIPKLGSFNIEQKNKSLYDEALDSPTSDTSF